MRLRTLFALLVTLLMAAVFVRLGLWQLSRHREHAANNAKSYAVFEAAPALFDSLTTPLDRDQLTLRRVEVTGRFRYDLEVVLAPRTSNGSPGVHLLTPLETEHNDTLLLVLRGWVYSANASGVELARWRERDSVTIAGYLVPLSPADTTSPRADGSYRSSSVSMMEARTGRPVHAMELVMTSDSTPRADSVPKRLPLPVFDSGPHWSYMIQWFAFAIIALVGGSILVRRSIVADRLRG